VVDGETGLLLDDDSATGQETLPIYPHTSPVAGVAVGVEDFVFLSGVVELDAAHLGSLHAVDLDTALLDITQRFAG